jgi:hypothetical protein
MRVAEKPAGKPKKQKESSATYITQGTIVIA